MTTLVYRAMELATEPTTRANEVDGKLPIAISSEAPVRRFDKYTGEEYWEVLDHSEKGPDLSYARDGLPLLLNHQLGQQIGIIENVRLENRKLRGDVRFGSHPDAQWIATDMRTGVRKKISVGYNLGGTYRQEPSAKGGLPMRFYTGWMPYEGSTVAVPADYGVGVGRTAIQSEPLPLPAAVRDYQLQHRTTLVPVKILKDFQATYAVNHRRQVYDYVRGHFYKMDANDPQVRQWFEVGRIALNA